MNRKRNYGIDLIKIIACILVITLHSLDPLMPVVRNNMFNAALYYAGTMAIPIFFMASGYFTLNKSTISYAYSLKRIKNILIIVIGWILLYSVAVLVLKGKFELLNQVKGSFLTGVSESHFYHFWFFWSLIIMLLIAPIIVKILQRSFKYYLVLTVVFTLICLAQDISLHFGYTYIMKDTPQVLRLNIWIEYYLLGGLVGNTHFNKIKYFVKQHYLLFSLIDIVLYVVMIIYSIWNVHIIGWAYAEANYNNILVILVAIISMTLFSIANPKLDRIIEFVIPATMGIYILQSFVIGIVEKNSIFSTYPVVVIPVAFILCLVIVKFCKRIPFVEILFSLK